MDFSVEAMRNIGLLAALAQAGSLYQVGQVLTATGLLNANFALVNKMGNGLPLFLLSARVQTTAAMEVDLFAVNADPALTAGNTPGNLLLGSRPAGATFEAEVIATPATNGQLCAVEGSATNQVELVSSGVIEIPSGYGILIASAAAAGNVALTLLWAEVPAALDDYLAARE